MLTLVHFQVFDSVVQESSLAFADLLAPVSLPDFMREVHRQKTLHIAGKAEKFAASFADARLYGLLEATDIWTTATLILMRNGVAVPGADYARSGLARELHISSQLIDVPKVNAQVQDGATLRLCDVGSLLPEFTRLVGALVAGLGGRIRADLWCTQGEGPISLTRFEIGDLYVVQLTGGTRWRLYERAFVHPIDHPNFKGVPEGFAAEHRGTLRDTVELQAGGLLYLPAGTCHEIDNLGDPSRVLVLSAEGMPALSLMSVLYECAVADELFRVAMPSPEVRGGQALDEYLMRLAGRLNGLLRDTNVQQQFELLVDQFRTARGSLTLPDDARGS